MSNCHRLGWWAGLLCVAGLTCSSSTAAPGLYPPLKPAWAFAAPGGFYSPPAIAGDRLFAGGVNGQVYCIDNAGQQVWNYALGGEVYGGIAVGDQMVYAASTGKSVVGLDRATGQERWRREIDGLVYATPRLVDDVLLVGTGDTGTVYGLDAATGAEQWRFPLGGRMGSGLTVADGLAYLPSYDQHLYAVEVANGLLRWQFIAAGPIDSMPLAVGDRLYVKLANDTVYALNRASGELIWQGGATDSGISSQPSNWSPLQLADGRLLYGSIDGRLHAIAEDTGRNVWMTAPDFDRPAPPTPAGELGFAGGKDGCLEAVDLESGRMLWIWRPEKDVAAGGLSGIMWPPAIVGTRVYASSLDGHLYAFDGQTDKAVWEASRQVEEETGASGPWPDDIPAMVGKGVQPSAAEIRAVTELGQRVQGFVVWESNRDGAWDLFRINTDGGQFKRLTTFADQRSPLSFDGYLRPRVSPDGKTILFAYGRRRAPVESWFVSAAGGDAHKVCDGQPLNWLPDGSGFYLVKDSLVVVHTLADGASKPLNGIKVPVDGRDAGMVGSVLPNRKAAVFRSPQRNEYFDFVQQKTIRTMGGCEPQFTVDGKHLFWVNGPKHFHVIDLATDQESEFLGQPPSDPYNYTYFPTVSADQRWIAYGASPGQHDHNTSDYEIFLQELKDWKTVGAPVRLSWHPNTDRWPCLWVGR